MDNPQGNTVSEGGASTEDDATCYIERSRVREIIIGVTDEHVHITEGILADIDQLPILTAVRPDPERLAAEDLADALRSELDSALSKLVQVLALGKSADEAAWWLCANHARFIIDHPNLISQTHMVAMAARAGTPPKGENWWDWFDRVRNLKPAAILKATGTTDTHRDKVNEQRA